MKKILRASLVIAGLISIGMSTALYAESPTEVKITLPPEKARFKPGPGMEAANQSCTICHSVDYIYMQPPLTKEEWHGEVMKMKKVFGCPIPDNDVDTVVNYLVSQNGKK